MNTDIGRSKKLRGSVLFTVLIVMMLLLIVTMSAIGLAGAASKRAYSTWYDNQTKYTAQDLVDNVINTFGTDPLTGNPGTNKSMGDTIIGRLNNKGDSVTVNVGVDSDGDGTVDGTYIPGFGNIDSLTFTYVAKNTVDYHIAGLSGHDNEKIIKVTAQVTMGGETSTYSRYVVGDAKSQASDGNGGGFIALSDLKGGSGSNDAPATVGRFYAGIDQKIPKTEGGNQTIDAGDVFINADEYYFNANKNDPAGIILGRNDPEHGFYGGMRVTGKLTSQNGITIQSQYPPAYINDLSTEKFFNAPYLYIDGPIEFNNQGIEMAKFNRTGTEEVMGLLNLYCDQLNLTGNAKLDGNINVMIMGENKTSTLKFSSSKLTDWAQQTITGVTNKGSMESGNFYSKGSVIKDGNGMEVNGDFCVVGDLSVTGDLTVHNGDVYVGGNLTGNVKVDAGRKIVANMGAGNSYSTFVTKLKALDSVMEADGVTKTYPNATSAATRLETAYKLKGDGANGVSYVQTIENITAQFKDTTDPSKQYKDVVNSSLYTGTEVWDGKGVITRSCIWDNTVGLNGDSNKKLSDGVDGTIYINPGVDEIWINIAPSLTCINQKLIIVDDSAGGKVKFFIEKGGATQNLDLIQTRIVTKTYYDRLYGSTPLEAINAYPNNHLIPHIFMYAAENTNVTVEMKNGNYMFTGDIIAPHATFRALSTNGVKKDVDYTYFSFIDLDGNGTVDVASGEMANPVRIKRNMDLCFVGSLEVGNIDVTNQFGYIYVDDNPNNGAAPVLAGDYSWTVIDGYSNY